MASEIYPNGQILICVAELQTLTLWKKGICREWVNIRGIPKEIVRLTFALGSHSNPC